MKLFYLLFLFPLISYSQATDIIKIANDVSLTDLQSNLYKLASPEMGGSFTASRGDTLAAEHIAGWFNKNKLTAPYDNGTSFFQSVPIDKVIISKAEISSVGKTYQQFTDWYVFPNSTYNSISLSSLPVVFGGYGIVSDKYNDLLGENVEGKVVIIVQLQPADNIALALAKSTRSTISSDYLKNLSDKGAAAVLVVTNDFDRASRGLRVSGALRSYRNPETTLSPLPRIYVSEKMINEILQPNDVTLQSLLINLRRMHRPLPFLTKATININVQLDSVREHAPNVIGMIRGKDTTAEAVVVSAHHDHLGKRGGQVFPGASDNAASNAMLMEIAKLMQKAAQSGLRPKRSIVFASFTGEEIGVLGSYHYVQNPLYPAEKTWAVYNLVAQGSSDSMHTGRPDSNYTYYLVRDTLKHGLLASLIESNQQFKLSLDDDYQQPVFPNRWLISSDAIAFYMKGVSVIQTGTGYPVNFHQSTDTPDKINFPLLAIQSKQAFLTLWNLANR